MANSVKLLNYLDPQGEYLRFYTELESDVEIDDKVFIIGGNYDNTKYTDKEDSEYNPFHPFAVGYTVIAVDTTSNSNAVTLNIKYSDATITSGGIETSVFDPKDVYKSEEELLIEPNQIREAYLSKSYFKRGEFNGGEFRDGVFGEYNIKGESSNEKYQRSHFVELLKEKLVADNDTKTLNKVVNYDYSTLESPAEDNKAVFNNNFYNIPATFSHGVFLGGEYQWGIWESKYNSNKEGNIQKLNDLGGITDILDSSKYDINSFSDNNNNKGYNIGVTGNFGRVYSELNTVTFIPEDNKVELNFLPFELKIAILNNFDTEVRIFSENNNRVLEVESIDVDNNEILFKPERTYNLYDGSEYKVKQKLYTEISGEYKVEVYIKHNERKANIINKGRFYSIDVFGGLIEESYFEGGDIHSGEFKEGLLESKYQQLKWYGGVVNGSPDRSRFYDVKWFNGLWLNGNWIGDYNFNMKNFNILEDSIEIIMDSKYKQIFEVGSDVFLSYFKKSLSNEYHDNYTDLPLVNLVNFQSFKLIDIRDENEIDSFKEVTLILESSADQLTDSNIQNARISQSHFKKGQWIDGAWDSGLREVGSYQIQELELIFENNIPYLYLDVDNTEGLRVGDIINLTNINLIRRVDVNLIPELNNTNSDEYLESLDYNLDILEIDNNTIKIEIPTLSDIFDENDQITGGELIGVSLIEDINTFTRVYDCIWEDGVFKSGAWRGGLWNNGLMTNELYFDPSNTQYQSIWQSGYWKNGEFNESVFLSGLWQNGYWVNSLMTNLYNNKNDNKEIGYDNGDSVWLNGEFDGGLWKGGLWKNGLMTQGEILNGGIESIDWKEGVYDNGLGLYDSVNNSNRSGKLDTSRNIYNQLSAPSIIYMDGDGWIQLDQPSFYQKDYNVIFQDLDSQDNPFNNQMFDVKNRDRYGSKIRIDYKDDLFKNNLIENISTWVVSNNVLNINIVDNSLNVVNEEELGGESIIFSNLIQIDNTLGYTFTFEFKRDNGDLPNTIYLYDSNNNLVNDIDGNNISKNFDSNSRVGTTDDGYFIYEFEISKRQILNSEIKIGFFANYDENKTYDFTIRNPKFYKSTLSLYDNPLTNNNNFESGKALLAIDHLTDFIEYSKTDNQHILWLLDKGHNRILEYDTLNNKVDVLGNVKYDTDKEKYDFINLKGITSPNNENVYVIDDNTVKVFIGKDTIFTLTPILDDGEEIVDISSLPQLSNLSINIEESVFILTNFGNVYYKYFSSEEFVKIETNTNGTSLSFSVLRNDIGNEIRFIIRYKDNDKCDFNYGQIEYNITTENYDVVTFETITNMGNKLSSNPDINTHTAYFNGVNINLYFVENKSKVIKFVIDDQNTISNSFEILNPNILEYPIDKLKMGWNNEYLILIGDDDRGTPLFFANSELDKISQGFSNSESKVKFLDIYQVLNINEGYQYWYYDNGINNTNAEKKLIYVDESNENFYDFKTDVDYIEEKYDIVKITNGINNSEVFSIQLDDTSKYSIRRSNILNLGVEIGSTIDIKFDDNTEIDKIYDIAFTRNNLFMLVGYTTTGINKAKIVAINDFSINEYNLDETIYFDSNFIVSGTSANSYYFIVESPNDDFKIDVIEKESNLFGVLSHKKQTITTYYDLFIDTENIFINEIYNNDVVVNDISISRDVFDQYFMFVATDKKVYRLSSDISNSRSIQNIDGVNSTVVIEVYNWAEFNSTDSDVVYTIEDDVNNTNNIEEIYRNINSNYVIIREGDELITIETTYNSLKVQPNELVTVDGFDVVGLNSEILISANEENYQQLRGDDNRLIGIYNQKNRLTSQVSRNNLLREPFSLNTSLNFNVSGHDFIFFIDNTLNETNKAIRYFNNNTSAYGVAISGLNYIDLFTNKTNNDIYYLENNNSYNIKKLIYDGNNFSSETTPLLSPSYTVDSLSGESSYEYKKISSLEIDTQKYFFLLKNVYASDTSILYSNVEVYELNSTTTSYDKIETSFISENFEINDLEVINYNSSTSYFLYTYNDGNGSKAKYFEFNSSFVKSATNELGDGVNVYDDINSINTFQNGSTKQFLINRNSGDVEFFRYNGSSFGKESNISLVSTEDDISENNRQFRTLSPLNSDYLFNTYNKGYKVYNDFSSQVLSPFITSRILYDTFIQEGVDYNSGGSIYTAHVVSTRWKNKTFLGSWDTPVYFNHKVLEKYSVFLSGTFEGIFYDGFFLGGTFKNGDITSVVKEGHFSSDSGVINFMNGEVESDYRYDIIEAKWNSRFNNLELKVEALKTISYDEDNVVYENTLSDKINYGKWIHIPRLFDNKEYVIDEIINSNISLDGTNNIILKIDRPEYYNEELWLNKQIFIRASEHVEYLFGHFNVEEVYVNNENLFLVIKSKFNIFDEDGVYSPIFKPVIVANYYNRIEDSEVIEENGKYFTNISLGLSIPDLSSLSGDLEKNNANFIQHHYLNNSIQLINNGDYLNSIVLPEHIQVFTLSFNKSYNDITLNFSDTIKHLYLSNIIEGVSGVYVDLDSNNNIIAKDIISDNSYITSNKTNSILSHCIMYQGETNRHWKNGGWLNIDKEGFSNGKSKFGNEDTLNKTFNGISSKIKNFEIFNYLDDLDNIVYDDNFMVITTDVDLNVLTNEYIYLRGFTGYKSTLLGAERSMPFKVIEYEKDFINSIFKVKLNNPLKYYKNVVVEDYQTPYSLSELPSLRTQVMKKSDANDKQHLDISNHIEIDFDYAYISKSCFNGGDFYGIFDSIWNSGNFRNGQFGDTSLVNSQWFAGNENYTWTGGIFINVENNLESSKFTIKLDVDNIAVDLKDLVYVKVNPLIINDKDENIIEPFYSKVVEENGNKVIKYDIDKILGEGIYSVSITRYRVNYTYLSNDYLITDYNSNIKQDSLEEERLSQNFRDWSVIAYGTSTMNTSYSDNNDVITVDGVSNSGSDARLFSNNIKFNRNVDYKLRFEVKRILGNAPLYIYLRGQIVASSTYSEKNVTGIDNNNKTGTTSDGYDIHEIIISKTLFTDGGSNNEGQIGFYNSWSGSDVYEYSIRNTSLKANGDKTLNHRIMNGYYMPNDQYEIGEDEINISKNSYFFDGDMFSDRWLGGVFINGKIELDNFVWKYGIKYNGELKTQGVNNRLHWLGGIHIGEDDKSLVSNIIWYRGKWKGGKWLKGEWLSVDLNMVYDDTKIQSIWSGGEWYSNNYINDSSNIYDLSLHDSIWYGGLWESEVLDNYLYSYEGKFKTYRVNNRNIQIQKAKSMWIGGLWLRGFFNGGVFLNGFWNSTEVDKTTSSNYENKIGLTYSKYKSVFKKGKILNSIWEGGIVDDNIDMAETIFGDLILSETSVRNDDFVWEKDFIFKKSSLTSNTSIYRKILGKDFFIGYHNGVGSKDIIESRRVRGQYNSDGIMSVYWKRGDFNNGIFQFSHWENKNLNNQDIKEISNDTTTHSSIFHSGMFYSSYWEGGIWYGKPSTDLPDPNNGVVPTDYLSVDEEPKSIFYKSQWEKGYWVSPNSDYLTGTVDDIPLTNALFSRSIWSAGVFEGGIIELSIWRSGVKDDVILKFKGNEIALTKYTNSNDSTLSIDNNSITIPSSDDFGSIQDYSTNQANESDETGFIRNTLDMYGEYDYVNGEYVKITHGFPDGLTILNNNDLIVKDESNVTKRTIDIQETTKDSKFLESGNITNITNYNNKVFYYAGNNIKMYDIITGDVNSLMVNLNVVKLKADFNSYINSPVLYVLTNDQLIVYRIDLVGNRLLLHRFYNINNPESVVQGVNNRFVFVGTDTTNITGNNLIRCDLISDDNKKTYRKSNFSYYGDNLPLVKINVIYENSTHLFVGTNGSGLWVLHYKSSPNVNVSQLITTSTNLIGSDLPSNIITGVIEKNSEIYITTNNGMIKIS